MEARPLGIRLPVDLIAQLDALATTEQRTRSGMVRKLLVEALDERERSATK